MQNEKNNIEKIMDDTIKNLSQMIEVNKIIGNSVNNAKGQMVIPVAKITTATFCGGGEYGDVKIIKESGEYFAGGSVTVSSIKPECFLIDNGDGFKVINKNGEGLEAFLKAIAKLVGNIKIK